jgi:hypothetical protein
MLRIIIRNHSTHVSQGDHIIPARHPPQPIDQTSPAQQTISKNPSPIGNSIHGRRRRTGRFLRHRKTPQQRQPKAPKNPAPRPPIPLSSLLHHPILNDGNPQPGNPGFTQAQL